MRCHVHADPCLTLQVTREASISDNWESADQPTLPAPSAKRQDAATADGRRQCACFLQTCLPSCMKKLSCR